MRNTTLWTVTAIVPVALIGAILDGRARIKGSTNRSQNSNVEQARSSGFNIKGEAILSKDGTRSVKSAIWASGPMSKSEVIMFRGVSKLKLPDGSTRVFGPIVNTFKDRLESTIRVDDLPAGTVVLVQGEIRVFRRVDMKVERELLERNTNRLSLNTGTVVFRKIKDTNPPLMEVICENLLQVHDHGMELMAKDKKTVAARILLSPGRQVIERESLPYSGVTIGQLQPTLIWQLIPKRTEPFELILNIRDSSAGK